LSKDNSKENSPDSVTNNNVNVATDNSITDSEWHTGYIQGNTFRNKEVKYRKVNGMAIFEGDIILARTPQEIERLSHEPKVPSEHEPSVRPSVKAVVRTGDQFRWPRGEIPFTIQSNLPNQSRITDAIRHWEFRTPIRFVQLTESNALAYPNYVSFIQYIPQQNEKQEEVFHCSSPIGMQGWGEQSVIVSDQCVTGDVIHEIGHVIGLWHEQSREDRDKFIRVIWDNVEPKSIHNFSQHIADGDDVGEYDYCSIMHYGAWFFNGGSGKQTIEVLQRERPCGNANEIGQKNGLSKGDIAAAVQMYGNVTPSIIQNADGGLEVISLGSDMKLCHKKQTSASNSSAWEPSNVKVGEQKWEQKWSSLGLETVFFAGDRPAITKDTSERLDVFWENDSNYSHCWQTAPNGSWNSSVGSENSAGDWDGDPVIARNSNGSPEVFWVYDDKSSKNYVLHHMSLNDHNYLPSLGGRNWSPNRRPAIAQNHDGRLAVFIVGLDRQLYHRWQTFINSSQWSEDWISLGGPLLGDPAVALDISGRLEVFKVDHANGQLYYRWQISPGDSYNWSKGWDSLEGYWSPRRTPAIIQNDDGRLEIFMVGVDGRLYHKWQTSRNSTTGVWEWYMQWDPLNWAPFEKEQWPPSSNPAVIRNTDGRLEVFMVDSKGQVYHTWQTVKNGTSKSQWSQEWALL
jgi:hypothetical protein